MRAHRCSEADRRGRAAKARQFHEAAQIIEAIADADDLIDAHVTLCVHAGIAAADAICCARLGEHAQGRDHRDAVGLLARVDADLAKDLGALLGLKTRAGYSAQPTSAAHDRTAARSAARLVEAIAGL